MDVIAAFVVTFSVPYLLGTPGANLGPKVAWIFAGISAASFVFVCFFVPELSGRSLEETDELFVSKSSIFELELTFAAGNASLGMAVQVSRDHRGWSEDYRAREGSVLGKRKKYVGIGWS